jgi:soluble lytic murein transglycosylase-like protein
MSLPKFVVALPLAVMGAFAFALPVASSVARSQPVDVELGPAVVSLEEMREAAAGSSLPVAPAPLAALGPRPVMDFDKGFSTPSEVDLLNELGLRANPQTEASSQLLARYVSRALSPAERFAYSRDCEGLVGANPRSFVVTDKSLACIPFALERVASERASRRRPKEERAKSLQGVRRLEQWPLLEGLTFSAAFARLDPTSLADLATLGAHGQATRDDCRYAGAAAALVARAEQFLPNDAALTTMDEYYPTVFRCLEPDDDGFERMHLRVGLGRLLRGDAVAAKQSLLLAAHAEDPQEDFRSWFWLGVIADSERAAGVEGSDPARYWGELRRRYPITIHSVLAAHAMGEDPVDNFTKGEPVRVARRVGQAWSEFNQASFVFELLLARQDAEALGEWSRFVSRNFEAPNPQAALFWAWCHSKAQNHRTAIAILTRYFKDMDGSGVNLDTLNLFFPRAYSEEIITHAASVDPVLLFSLIRQESAFDPRARSVADARGLMQLLPSTARQYIRDPDRELWEPTQNVKAGVAFMQHLLKRYNGNVEHVLAAYNAGASNLDKWRKRFPNAGTLLFADLIPFKETRTYVAIIQRNAYWYGRLMVLQKDSLARTMQARSEEARWRSETVHNLLGVAWGREAGDRAVASLERLYSVRRDGAAASLPGSTKP